MPQFPGGINLTTTPSPGSGHDYIKMLDETVNPANGSLSVRVDAPVPKQRGDVNFPYYVFGYDSGGITFPMAQVSCNSIGNGFCQNYVQIKWADATGAGPCWNQGWFVANTGIGQVCSTYVGLYTQVLPNADNPGAPQLTATCNYYTGFTYTDPYGSQHPLGLQWATTNNGGGADEGCFWYSVNSWITTGGDFHYQAEMYPGPNGISCSQTCPESSTYVADAHGRGWGTEDTNGNSGFRATTTVTNGKITAVSIPGLSSSYTFTYGTTTRNYTPGTTLIASVSDSSCPTALPTDSATITVVKVITLPNGQTYKFYYGSDTTAHGAPSNPYGLLSEIDYPTGAWVSYTWSSVPSSESLGLGTITSNGSGTYPVPCYYRHAWPYVQKRIVSFNGTNQALEQDFTYTTNWGTGSSAGQWTQKTTTVQTKDLLRPGTPTSQTVYTYSPVSVFDLYSGMFTGQSAIENQIAYSDFSGATLRTVTKNWQPEGRVPDSVLLSECMTLPNSGPTSGAFYTYGNLGVLTDKKEYDYGILSSNACAQGASAPTATATRETVYTYQSFPNTPLFPGAASIFDRPTSVKVYDHGSSSPIAETDYAYDQTAVGSVSPTAIGHDETNFPPSYNNRGNVTTETVKCLQTGCPNAVTTYTYDETGQVLSMVDPNGNAAGGTPSQHTTSYSYADNFVSGDTYTSSVSSPGNTNTFLTQITHPPTNGTTHIENFSYDYPSGQLTVSKDQNGQSTTYRYDDAIARPTQTNSPDGGQTTISYNDSPFNSTNNTPSVTTTKKITSGLNLGGTTAMDGMGHTVRTLLTSDPEGTDTTDTTYDGLGRVFTQSNPHRSSGSSTDGTRTYAYDALGRTTAVTEQDGSIASSTYSGACTTVTDEAGKIRKSCSDGLGRLIEVDEPGAGATVGTPGTGTVTITGGPDQSGTFNMCPNTYPYNCPQFVPDGGQINVTVNGFTASGGYGQGSTTQGIASAITSTLNSSSSPVTASLSGSTITMTSKATGSASNYSLSTSVNWNSQFFNQPSFNGSPSGSTLTGGSDASVGPNPLVTLYTYDALSNLTCAVQKGTDTTAFSTCAAASATWRPRSFVYDSLSRLTSAANPESGTISYTYDANGNLLTKVAPIPNKIPADTSSPQTVTTTFTYDALNRLTKKTYSDGTTPTVQFGYDGVALSGCTYTPPTLSDTNPKGRRTSMCDGSGATTWALDITSGTGWKSTESRKLNGSSVITKNIVSQNNFGGMLYQLTYPSTRMITYTPNGSSGTAARYASAVDSADGVNYAQNATYGPFGGLTGMTNGSAPITTTNAYNERLQPVTLSASTTPATVFSLSYDFHRANGDNGSVFQIVNNRDNNRNQTFTYDALNRIASGQSQSTSGPTCWGESFTIDNWGNLTNRSVTKCTAESLNAPVAINNQISGYCYDKAGNLLGNTGCPSLPYTPTYTYDAENRLKTTAGVTYTYDGDGNRVKKSNGTLYWGSGPLAESDLSGTSTTWKEYVFFNGKRIARRDASNSSVHYYFSDHLGSSSIITDALGTMSLCTNSPLGYTTVPTGEDESDYFPYGGERQLCNRVAQNYKFTGKERDTESGLDSFGRRYYASSLARWTSPDPINLTSARLVNPTNTLNKYVYAANNPLKYVDRDGEDITIFYRPSSGALGDQGHILLGVLNQESGKVAFLDYYPAGKLNGLGQGPGAFNPGNMSERAQQNAEGKFATLTIQTSPDQAQKVIDLIDALKNGPTPDFSVLSKNCTTVCQDVLKDLGLDFGDIVPSSYWADVYYNFSADAQAHPFWTRLLGTQHAPGYEYGNPRNFPGVRDFSQWLFTLFMNQQQQPQPKATVTTTEEYYIDCNKNPQACK